MPAIELHPPNVAHRATFLAAIAEFQREGLPWWQGDALNLAVRDFPAFVANKCAEATHEGNQIPKTHLWAFANETFVGRIGLFHRLSPALELDGGHIGYDTLPSRRGQGIATEMLRLTLPVAREIGLTQVLLTCRATNTASVRVIEHNGGVLVGQRRLTPEGPLKQSYTITL